MVGGGVEGGVRPMGKEALDRTSGVKQARREKGRGEERGLRVKPVRRGRGWGLGRGVAGNRE